MPEYEVIGADRATGNERRQTVLAASEDEAARMVGRSMLIERVRLVPDLTPPWAGPAHQQAAPAPVSYASPAASRTPKAPDYLGIRVGAGFLVAVGLLSIAAGLYAIAGSVEGRGGSGASEGIANASVFGFALVGNGVFLIFCAGIGMAIRDIARNSFGR